MAEKDAVLSLSDGGSVGRVRDSGGLGSQVEPQGLTLRSSSFERDCAAKVPTSQISSPQAPADPNIVAMESQAVSSVSNIIVATASVSSTPDRAAAATYTGSVDLSIYTFID